MLDTAILTTTGHALSTIPTLYGPRQCHLTNRHDGSRNYYALPIVCDGESHKYASLYCLFYIKLANEADGLNIMSPQSQRAVSVTISLIVDIRYLSCRHDSREFGNIL